MSYSLLIFVGIILFLILVFGIVISSLFLTETEEPKQVNRTSREHNTKTLKEAIERNAIEEKLNRKVSTSEDIFISSENQEVSSSRDDKLFSERISNIPSEYISPTLNLSELNNKSPTLNSGGIVVSDLSRKTTKPERILKEGSEEEPIHILENEADKEELKRKIPPSQQNPPSPSISQRKQVLPKERTINKILGKEGEKGGEKEGEKEGEKLTTRGVLPKKLMAGHKKEVRYNQQREKRIMMKQELQDRASIYKDPTEGICVHTRADCPDYTSDCFLGAGHLDLKECVEKAERIQENIDKHNERFGSADTRRKSGVKYISWAPGGVYPDIQNPQCMILSDSAKVVVDQKGWKTYVKNPTSFTMTQNPSVYLVEGKCPTIKE